MGVLGGLFILGVGTKRTTATGAICGAAIGSAAMIYLWQFTQVNGYLYTSCGITACVASGYITSLLTGPQTKDLEGLTIVVGTLRVP